MHSGQASPGQLASSYPALGRLESGHCAMLRRQHVSHLRELHRRTRDMFMRLMDGPKHFRRRRKFGVCHPVLLFTLPTHHFGFPIYHAPIVEQRPPSTFGPLAECGWGLCAFLRTTVEGGNP